MELKVDSGHCILVTFTEDLNLMFMFQCESFSVRLNPKVSETMILRAGKESGGTSNF